MKYKSGLNGGFFFAKGDLKITKLNIFKSPNIHESAAHVQDQIFSLKFFQFFRNRECDFKIIYYLLDTKFNYLCDIISLSSNKVLYYQFLLQIIFEYKKLCKLFNNNKTLINPSSYLTSFSSKYTASSLLEQGFSLKNLFFLKKKLHKTAKKVKELKSYIYTFPFVNKFQKGCLNTYGFDYSLSMYIVHFLRVQRRYNKRRYSKVRVYSRPSFFGGICLGSLFISCFCGGTIKSVDCYITTPIVVDMNLVLLFVFLLTFIRVLVTEFSITSLHNFAKIRIYRFLRLILSNKIVQSVLKSI